MLAEMKEPSLPHLDKASGNIHWEGRVFPFSNFYFINETTTLLLNILERNPLRESMPKETVSSLLLGQNDFLGQSLSGTSAEVLRHWVYVSMAIKCYILSQEDEERLNAIKQLLTIREMLHLDRFFGKRKSFSSQK